MHGWRSERQDWKFDGRGNWWVPLLMFGGFIWLVSTFGWWWLWFPFFFFVLPAMFGGWSGRHGARGWAREGRGWSMCGSDDTSMKRKHEFDGEKPKRDGMYVYREDGEVLEVRDAPEKPKRDEYV